MARWAEPARRLRCRVRRVGPGHALWLAFQRLLGGRRVHAAWVHVLELVPPPNGSPGARVTGFRWGEMEDAPRLASLGAHGDLRGRLAKGDRLCILESDGEPVASLWLRADEWEEPDLAMRFKLSAQEVWLYNGFVPRPLRGRGIYRRLLEATMFELFSDGVARILLLVDAPNRNSLRSHRAVGARTIATLVVVRVGQLALARGGGALRFPGEANSRGRQWTAFRAPPPLELPRLGPGQAAISD